MSLSTGRWIFHEGGTDPVGRSDDTMKEILNDAFVKREMEYWNIPGLAVGVIKDGEILLEKGYGYRNLETKEPMTPYTLQGIASCSKSFTSAVLASLVDEGILDYDQPVSEYIPDFALMDPVATKEATIRDMLYHRTGLAGHDGMWPLKGVSREEYMHRLRYLQPNKPFRSTTHYSNVIYNLLGCIAERVTQKTWEELVEERIFKPLGMERSCLTVKEMRQDPDYATGYFERERGKKLLEMPPWEMGVGAPAAAVNTCAHEMLKWLKLHLDMGVYEGRRLFSEQVMYEMHKGAVPMNLFPWKCEEIPESGMYGMAWKSFIYRGMPFVFHTGEIEGYCTMQAMIPGKKIGIILLVNRHKPCSPFLSTMAYTIIDHLLNLPEIDWAERLHAYDGVFGGTHYNWKVDLMPGEPVEHTELSHKLEEYTGVYENPAYGELKVELVKNGLYLHFKDWLLPMEHFHYDTFRVRGVKEDTIFITMPMTYHYEELTGKVDGFSLKLEPEVAPVWFAKRVAKE